MDQVPPKKRRRRASGQITRDDSHVERDFEIFKTEIKRQTESERLTYTDGALLMPDMGEQPACSCGCSFVRVPNGNHKDVYVCQTHFRIHRCGSECQERILNRENWTCPLTMQVLDLNLFAEAKNSTANCGRHNPTDTHNSQGFGDDASEKSLKRCKRVQDAMKEASEVCADAIKAENLNVSDYKDALYRYFAAINYHTDMFGGNQVLTKKAIVQFGLACSYMHRSGYSLKCKSGKTITFFKKRPLFVTHLPKTHALIQMGYKVRAITRTQDTLRGYLCQALVDAPDLDLVFCPMSKTANHNTKEAVY